MTGLKELVQIGAGALEERLEVGFIFGEDGRGGEEMGGAAAAKIFSQACGGKCADLNGPDAGEQRERKATTDSGGSKRRAKS